MTTGDIPVDKVRDAVIEYLKSHDSDFAALARELNWFKSFTENGRVYLVGDSTRVRRTLGIQVETSHGKKKHRKTMKTETAMKFLDIIGRDPWEFDI